MNGIIEIRSLYKSYKVQGKKDVNVYSDFSLNIAASNHFICLTGPDGAGKSTLLKLLSGVIRPDGGEVLLDGLKPDNNSENFTKVVGYMSQTLGLYGELSVFDNLRLFSGLKGLNLKENSAYLLDLLEKVNLLQFKDREADALSGGMKQKLGLTCAIASKPRILILDEPTVGVDPVSRQELWDIIYDYINKAQAYCIFSTAYLEEAAKADITLMMNDARVVLQGKPSDISKKMDGRTYSVELGELNYQKTVREVMSISERCFKGSPLIDVCPRLSKIDIVTKDKDSKKTVYDFLKDNLSIEVTVEKRKPILEDAYIYQSYLNRLQKESDDTSCSSTTADTYKSSEKSTTQKNKSFCTPLKVTPYDTGEPVVMVDKIKKKFGNFTAVHQSSFKVHKGEIFGLLGPNGAGKTTTFRMICALLKPTSGNVTVNGFDLKHAKDDARATIGYVSQKFSLYRKLNVYQNLEYFGLSYGLEIKPLKARIEELLDEFSLRKYKDIQSEDLPFGLQRQLSMACALIHKPKILFLDEATSGADPVARRVFWDRVSALASSGTCVIVTTHFMEESEYCDNFLIQDQGKILVLGVPDKICIKDGHRISIEQAFVELVHKFRAQKT